jgi:chemotaxis protein histidine kinase CheA
MGDVIREFVAESNENLQRMEQELVQLETDPGNTEIVDGIFRAVHTVKGTCGFFDFSGLEELSHAGESLLSRLRDGEVEVSSEVADALLALVDAIRRYLANIEADGSEGTVGTAELVARLEALTRGDAKKGSTKNKRSTGRRSRTKTGGSTRSKAAPRGKVPAPEDDAPENPEASSLAANDKDPTPESEESVRFRQINRGEPWPPLPAMDIVFLRNVLIYLDENVRRAVLRRIRHILKPDGHLFLGAAESSLGSEIGLNPERVCRTTCYRLDNRVKGAIYGVV